MRIRVATIPGGFALALALGLGGSVVTGGSVSVPLDADAPLSPGSPRDKPLPTVRRISSPTIGTPPNPPERAI